MMVLFIYFTNVQDILQMHPRKRIAELQGWCIDFIVKLHCMGIIRMHNHVSIHVHTAQLHSSHMLAK